jgi:hypothetical protein
MGGKFACVEVVGFSEAIGRRDRGFGAAVDAWWDHWTWAAGVFGSRFAGPDGALKPQRPTHTSVLPETKQLAAKQLAANMTPNGDPQPPGH